MINNHLKKTGIAALFWMLLSLLILGGATFAWFTFTSYTNVKPMTGSVGNGGADLKISSSSDGPFSESTDLIVNGNTESIQPVSTYDQKEWYSSISHNSQGITNRYQSVSDKIDELSMYGTVYLKSEGGACDVYFDAGQLSFGDDPQLLSSCRLGLTIDSQEGSAEHIFNFDSYVNVSGLEKQLTTDRDNAVVSSIDGEGAPAYDADPSEPFSSYAATVSEETVMPGDQVLVHLKEDEIATVTWRLYMEGCDEHCVNVVQNKEVSMNLAFAGVGTAD